MQVQEFKACERPTERIKWAWCDIKNYSLRLANKPHRKDSNTKKEEDSFTALCIEKWTKFWCHSCYKLAENKRCSIAMNSRVT
jgi:hypothetical protein